MLFRPAKRKRRGRSAVAMRPQRSAKSLAVPDPLKMLTCPRRHVSGWFTQVLKGRTREKTRQSAMSMTMSSTRR